MLNRVRKGISKPLETRRSDIESQSPYSHRIQTAKSWYEKNQKWTDIGVFLGGFLFDIFTLSAIDDLLSLLQQVVYLFSVGGILYFHLLDHLSVSQTQPETEGRTRRIFEKFWPYRNLALHFTLGSLLSTYSLFFIKSASIFTSFVFVILLLGVLVGNELPLLQKRADAKVALFVLCLFCFFSVLFPVVLGFVGILPFLLALAVTGLVIFLFHRKLSSLRSKTFPVFLIPSFITLLLVFLFYLFGWIPPVPLSVQNMGVYHDLQKIENRYLLKYQSPWWKLWQTDSKSFVAQEGDKLFFFAKIFSPGRFEDTVILHWYFDQPNRGWTSTDKIPMRVLGGSSKGYRGYSVKQNLTPGNWRVSVETTDSREIGRYYFDVTRASTPDLNRQWKQQEY